MSVSEIIREFLLESTENLDALDHALMQLEQNPEDAANIAAVFRTIHTIKGTAGFLGFSRLEKLAHGGENLLGLVRDGSLRLDGEIASALLRVVDATRGMLGAIESTGSESCEEHTDLIETLQQLSARKSPDATANAPVVPTSHAPMAPAATTAPAIPAAGPDRPSAAPGSALSHHKDDHAGLDSDATAMDNSGATCETDMAHASAELMADRRAGHDRRAQPERRQSARRGADEPAEDRGPSVADSALRVDVGLLDRLMNLVGELVLARNQIVQFTAANRQDSNLSGAVQRLNLVTSELQEGVMKTRMQPIGNVWSKFPRVVRDLAVQCGRQVRIEMDGKETELDKTIIEAIKDPLTHIVRNAVDHGIEPAEERIKHGKPAEGVLTLRAFHASGQITIEVADDGAGVDADRVRQKACARGLVTADQATRLTDQEALDLVFLPGFSTKDTITNISGRGVGMDVVRTNIERIGGAVDILSQAGAGTTLRIKIPLTLAIIPALMVTAGGDRFAIPQAALVELVLIEPEQVASTIERIGDAAFHRLRGNLLPLVNLQQQLGLGAAAWQGPLNIAVVNADGRQFGLVVESIRDTEEIVVKPLGRPLKSLSIFAGATIMGDGTVALILDVMGLARKAGLLSDGASRAARRATQAAVTASADEHDALLLFQGADDTRMAIPLAKVARLEEFAAPVIERSGHRHVIQYRGEILPLVAIDRGVSASERWNARPMQVIVCSEGQHSVGLVVDRILDIVSWPAAANITETATAEPLTVILQQRVTEILRVETIFDAAAHGTATVFAG